jgi:predicted amidophosphoribosyltransferase
MKKISKQKRWRLKKLKEGNCQKCGKPRNKYKYDCDKCAKKLRGYQRERAEIKNLTARYNEQDTKLIKDALSWIRKEILEGRFDKNFDKKLFIKELLSRRTFGG